MVAELKTTWVLIDGSHGVFPQAARPILSRFVTIQFNATVKKRAFYG